MVVVVLRVSNPNRLIPSWPDTKPDPRRVEPPRHGWELPSLPTAASPRSIGPTSHSICSPTSPSFGGCCERRPGLGLATGSPVSRCHCTTLVSLSLCLFLSLSVSLFLCACVIVSLSLSHRSRGRKECFEI